MDVVVNDDIKSQHWPHNSSACPLTEMAAPILLLPPADMREMGEWPLPVEPDALESIIVLAAGEAWSRAPPTL
jgi:hypothetical protein